MRNYEIGAATVKDLAYLPAIELAAATLLAGYAPEPVLQETTSDAEFRLAQSEGRLWVARTDHLPVGFAHAGLLEPLIAHLIELDVHPDHGRQGLGRLLVLKAIDWAGSNNFAALTLTLTTFREAPFNMPFYRKIGFEEIKPPNFSFTVIRLLAAEAERGLDPSSGVVMCHQLDRRSHF